MNRAAELFERIKADGFAIVQGFVDDRESEDTWLEFKDGSQMNWKDLVRYYSEAISGFGNTDGGLLIWGVATKKRDNIDYADSLALISADEVLELKAGLDGTISRATFPPNSGVENIVVETADKLYGVVVSYIPLSPHRPLQRQTGRRDFKMRAGDSFVELPYRLLASLFGRAAAPEIRADVQFTGTLVGDPGDLKSYRFSIEVRIRNIGSVLAENFYVSLRAFFFRPQTINNSRTREPHRSTWNYRVLKPGRVVESVTANSLASQVLTPNERLEAFQVDFDFTIEGDFPTFEDVRIDVIAGARDSIPHRMELSLRTEVLAHEYTVLLGSGKTRLKMQPESVKKVYKSNLPLPFD